MNAIADNVRARLVQIRTGVDRVVDELEIAGDDMKARLASRLKEVQTELGDVIEELEAPGEDEPA